MDAEFRVPRQGLELYLRPGLKSVTEDPHWWWEDAELDDETGFWSLEIEGTICSEEIGFVTICGFAG